MKRILFVLAAFCVLSGPVLAQENVGDPAKRLELSKKMHEINPTADQINAAIDDVALAQPEAEREAFKLAMRNALNYEALDKISTDAMAEVYTEAELQAMVDYFSKPEAQSAAKKEEQYNAKVYPEITRMLDQAMMRVRTGGQ